MRWNGFSRRAGGRRAIDVPSVPSMTDPGRSTAANARADRSDRQSTDRAAVQPIDRAAIQPIDRAAVQPIDRAAVQPIDRAAVQYLDSVRAIFRPARRDTLAPELARFIGQEDIFRHVGTADMGADEAQAMMQCPVHWPGGVKWVPIRDLEILEILEDQDVRAG